jgi:hypothetical protein
MRIVTAAWTPQELDRIDEAEELRIATKRLDGTMRSWVPIWVVRADGEIYVRTWYRRDAGWFGHALASRRARIQVPRLETDVAINDVGEDRELRAVEYRSSHDMTIAVQRAHIVRPERCLNTAVFRGSTARIPRPTNSTAPVQVTSHTGRAALRGPLVP